MAKKRKYGSGTVRKRSDGRWEARVVVGYDDNGKPKTKNVLAKTKAECLVKLEELKEKFAPPVTRCKPDMPFGDWMDFWYQNYCKPQLRLNTQLGYEDRIYKHIIPEIGKIPLNQLTQSDLQQFYAKLKTSGRLIRVEQYGPGLSDRMVRVCHANCRSALQKAVEEGLIRINPAIGCKLPPKKSGEMNILTQEEMQRFLIQAKQDGYYELFLLELGTGLRLGEILALQWDDLNMETGELRITKSATFIKGELHMTEPKTKSSIRVIVLPSSLLEILKNYKAKVTSRWMFPSPVKEDCPLTPNFVRRRMQQTLERAQCKKVRFHDLRHTFATMALEHGMDVKTLSTIIGHISSATTLDIYSHVTDTRIVLRNIQQQKYKIIYIAPERLLTENFLSAINNLKIAMLAVDEAHCISQWGQDFRPSYLRIAGFLRLLKYRPVISAFTATATYEVREDVERILELQNPLRVITGYDRPNLRFEVVKPRSKPLALQELVEARLTKSGIIYCSTRKEVEKVCLMLKNRGISATRYHAGLPDEERLANQDDFIYDRCKVMVATNAFGMGIDKSNVGSAVFDELTRKGIVAGRKVFVIYPSADNKMVLRCMNNNKREYIFAPELNKVFSYSFSLK